MMQFRLPGEAQQIDRILEKFAARYHTENPGVFFSPDTAYILAFSIIMLNTDLHNQSITPEKKMTLDQFIKNNRGINQGKDMPREILVSLYTNIRDDEIRMDEADMYESEVVAFMAPTKSGWLSKKTESLMGHWKRHWFVLNDGCLYYFFDPSDKGKHYIVK
jgi:cytohesin